MGGNKKGGKNGAGGGGGGGGGKKKKKKEQEVKETLTEVDKEYYELQLTDLNRKLTRLQARSAELETTNAELQESLSKLDEDRSDIIAFLKKALQQKTSELVESQERLDGLKQSMDSNIIKYKEEIAQKKQEYKNVHEELTSEIKLLMGKLNSLEEFRTQKEELIAKFATQEQQIEEQEQRHKRELYEYEKKFIVEKEKLKRQMETRLLRLSVQLQDATSIRIAATTHRMIRENIAINNEMTIIQETQKEMNESYERMKSNLKNARLETKVLEEEKTEVLNKNLILLKAVNKMTEEHKKYNVKLSELEKTSKECSALREKLKKKELELKDTKNEVKALTDRLASGQTHTAKLYAEVAALKLNSRRLTNTLHRAVIAVKEALTLQENNEVDEALTLSRRSALLNNLLQLLNRAETAEKERLESYKTPASYTTGDLGLVPRPQ